MVNRHFFNLINIKDMEFKKYLVIKEDNVPYQLNLVEPVTINNLDRFVKIKYWSLKGLDDVERELIINLDIIKTGL